MPNHTGAMIALQVPDPENFAINPPTEQTTPPEELHITLAYMGEASEITQEQRDAVLDAVQTLADTSDAPKGLFPANSGMFPPDPESPDATPLAPYYAAPSNPENFNALREDLLVHLSARGVGELVSTKHPVFHPHVTLAYAPLDAPPDLSHLPTPLPTTFSTIICKFGDETHTFDLSRPAEGPELPLTASVRANLHTLSARTETSEDYLTSLYLRQRQVRSTPAQTRAQAALEAVAAAVDPTHRTQGYHRVQELTNRASLEADPLGRVFVATRALALAARTPAPQNPNEARELAGLTASLRALIADGNSSVARSLRAKAQLRDRYGRWIEMGGGVRFKVRVPGAPGGGTWYHGTVEGFDIPNGRVNVKLEDGRVVAIPNKKLEQPKAILGLDIGKAVNAAKKFLPKSAGKPNKATLPDDHDPAASAARKAEDDEAVAAMHEIQQDVQKVYPDATVSGGNVAPLINDPNLKSAETGARDAGDKTVKFSPTKKPKGTKVSGEQVELSLDNVDKVRKSLDRMTAQFTPSQDELDGMDESERNKAVATARSKAYGRMAVLYNERGADQELLRAPAVGTDEELQPATPSVPDAKSSAPTKEELISGTEDSYSALEEAIDDASPSAKSRDRIGQALAGANSRFADGTDDQATYLDNLDRIKEYANAQSYGSGTEADALAAFAEDLDNVHAAGGGTDEIAKVREALESGKSVVESAVNSEHDAGPQGWSAGAEDLNNEISAIEKALDDGKYLDTPDALATDLRDLADSFDQAQGLEVDQDLVSETSDALRNSADGISSAKGEVKATIPEATEDPVDKRAFKHRTKQIPQMSKRDLAREIAQRVLGDTPLDESNPEHKKLVDSWGRSGRDFLEKRVAHDRDVDSKVKTDDPIERQLVDAETTATGNPKGANNLYPGVNVHTQQNPDGSYSYTVTPNSGEPITDLDRQGALDEINKHGTGTSPLEEPSGPVVSETIDEATAPEGVDDPASYFGSDDPLTDKLTNTFGTFADLMVNDAGTGFKSPKSDETTANLDSFMDALSLLQEDGPSGDLGQLADNLEIQGKQIIKALRDEGGYNDDALDSFDLALEDLADEIRGQVPSTTEPKKVEKPRVPFSDFQDVYDTLSDLPVVLDPALNDPLSAVANTVLNTGKSLEQGKITNAQAVEYIDNALDEITQTQNDLENIDKLDGTELGDDLNAVKDDITQIRNSLQNAGPAEETPTPEPTPAPEEVSVASPELEDAQKKINQIFDDRDHELNKEPDFESGGGAGWKPSEQAQADYAKLIESVNQILDDFAAGDSASADTVNALGDAADAWHTSDGYAEIEASDDSGLMADSFYIGDAISDLIDSVPELNTASETGPTPPPAPEDAPVAEAPKPRNVPDVADSAAPATETALDAVEAPEASIPAQVAPGIKPMFDALDAAMKRAQSTTKKRGSKADKTVPAELNAPAGSDLVGKWQKSANHFQPINGANTQKWLVRHPDGSLHVYTRYTSVAAGTDSVSSDPYTKESGLVSDGKWVAPGGADLAEIEDDVKDVINDANLYLDELDTTDASGDPDTEAFVAGEKDRVEAEVADILGALQEDGWSIDEDGNLVAVEPEKSATSPEESDKIQGIINQLLDKESPIAKMLAAHLQTKLDNGEPLSDEDIDALKGFIDFVGSSSENTPEEKADYTNASDDLDPVSAVPASEVPEVPAGAPAPVEDEPLADWEKELLGIPINQPDVDLGSGATDFNAEGALDKEAAVAAWQKSLEDYLNEGGYASVAGSPDAKDIHTTLSPSQREYLAKIIEDLPAVLSDKLEEVLNRHIDEEATDDELVQSISEILLDIPWGSKLRGRLRGAQSGIQQNKGVLIPILRPKPEAYKKSDTFTEADLVLSPPEVVKGTLAAIIKQHLSGNDLKGITDTDGDSAETKAKIAEARTALENAAMAFNSGDAGAMIDNMRAALDAYDEAIALRSKIHKNDTIVRRLRARRRALDEVLAPFEGRWPDPKLMGNPQQSNDYYNYDSTNGQEDRYGQMVYPGDKIKRTHKTALDQTGLVLGWKQLVNGKWTAHLWLDAEQKDRPQGVTQTMFVIDAVGPNNPLYSDPSYTGPRVDDKMNSFIEEKKNTVSANQAKKQAAKAAKAPAAEAPVAPPAPTPLPTTFTGDIDAATTVEQLDDIVAEINSAFDTGEIPENLYSNLINKANAKIDALGGKTTPATAQAAVPEVGDDLAGHPNIAEELDSLPTNSVIHITSDHNAYDGDWTKDSNGEWIAPDDTGVIDSSDFEHVPVDSIVVQSTGPAATTPASGPDSSAFDDILTQIQSAITTGGTVLAHDAINAALQAGKITEGQAQTLRDMADAKYADISKPNKNSGSYNLLIGEVASATTHDELDNIIDNASADYNNGHLTLDEYSAIADAADKKRDELGPQDGGGGNDTPDNVPPSPGGTASALPENYTQPPEGAKVLYSAPGVQEGEVPYVVQYADGSLHMHRPKDSIYAVPGTGGINSIEATPDHFKDLPDWVPFDTKTSTPDIQVGEPAPFLGKDYPVLPKGSKVLFQTKEAPGHDPGYVVQFPDGKLHNVSTTPSLNFEFNEDSQDPVGFANSNQYEPYTPNLPVFHALPNNLQGKKGEEYVMVNGQRKWGRYGAAGIAVTATDTDGTKKVLLGQRGDTGIWYLPGGALEELESPIQGATREFHEEVLNGETVTPNLKLVDTIEQTLGETHAFDKNGVPQPTGDQWKYTTLVAELPEVIEVTAPPDAASYEFVNYVWADEDLLASMDANGDLHPALSNGAFAKMIGMDTTSTPETSTPAEAETPVPDSPAPESLSVPQYDISGWKKVSGSLGSQKGGIYEDENGNQFYVKTPHSPEHAHIEVLGSKFYETLGVNAPKVRLGKDAAGKLHIVSPIVSGADRDALKKAVNSNDTEFLNKIRADFAIDAWLGNYDVTGSNLDNIIADADGNPVRVDQGGAMLYRGTGAKKWWWSADPTDIDDMRSGNNSASVSYPKAKQLFGKMTDEQVAESAKKLAGFSPKEIQGLVNATGLDPATKSELIDTLTKRRHAILERFDLLSTPENVSSTTSDPNISALNDAQALVEAANPTPTFTIGQQVWLKSNASGVTGKITVVDVLSNGFVKIEFSDGSQGVWEPDALTAEDPSSKPTPVFTKDGHDYIPGETVYVQMFDGSWAKGVLADEALTPTQFGFNADLTFEDGTYASQSIDGFITEEAYKAMPSMQDYKAVNTPTTEEISLGTFYAKVPSGSKVLKYRSYYLDASKGFYLVQHSNGELNIYTPSGEVELAKSQSIDSYKFEKGWVNANIDVPTTPTSPINPTLSGEWSTPEPVEGETPEGVLLSQTGQPINLGDIIEVTKYKPKDWVGTFYGVVISNTLKTGQVKIRVYDEDGNPMFKDGAPYTKFVNPKNAKHHNMDGTPPAASVPATAPAEPSTSVPPVQPKSEGLPDGVVLADPDTSSPLYGEDKKPVAPVLPSVVVGEMVDQNWIDRASAAYSERKVSKGQAPKKAEESSYWDKYYKQVFQGDESALEFLQSNGYFASDPDLYAEAKGKIQEHNEKLADAVAEFKAEQSKYNAEFAEWMHANGQAYYTPIHRSQAKGLSKSEMKNWAALHWTGIYTKLSSSAKSALASQKGSSGWQQAIRLIDKTLGLKREHVAKTASPSQMKLWDDIHNAAEEASLHGGAVPEHVRAIRTVSMKRFADAAGIPFKDSHSATGPQDLTKIIGTIQKDHGAAEITFGSLDHGGKAGFSGGFGGETYDVVIDLTVPAGTKGVYTGGSSGNSHITQEEGFIMDPGMAMYIWDVIPIKPSETVGGASNGKWKVIASIIPQEVLPYMNDFEGAPGAHNIYIPGNGPAPGTKHKPNALKEGGVYDGSHHVGYSGNQAHPDL